MNQIKNIKDFFVKNIIQNYPENEAKNIFDLILRDQFKLYRLDLIIGEKKLSKSQINWINNAVIELKNNKPIQQIIGYTYFCNLKHYVNKHTLIPRPETEELVHWILKDYKEGKGLDIGTGSGCISVALAHKNIKMYALDTCKNAIKIARKNAEENNCNISFLHTNILQDEIHLKNLDFIVSNPPYVLETEKERMHQNVLKFEPEIALFVPNDDPLLFYKIIAIKAKKILKNNGAIYFEIHENYSEEMTQLMKREGYTKITLKKDLQEKNRMLKAYYTK